VARKIEVLKGTKENIPRDTKRLLNWWNQKSMNLLSLFSIIFII
jgi:hypothetical protein